MAREIERLSDREAKNKSKPGYYHDGAGLYLQVSDSGTKSWIFRYTLNGRTREMGIGSYLAFGLAEARERARAQRKLLADGLDPIEARNAQRAQDALAKSNTLTFAECAARYIAANRAGWRNPKHVAQWENTLQTYAGPVLGKLPVRQIDTARVVRVLEPMWTKTPETANRLRGRIEHVLDWAKVHGYRSGENPARWRGHLDKILPKRGKVQRVEHHPALPYAKVNAFLEALREQPGTAPRALEFLILTAARTGEVVGARPEEFDLDAGIWTIPAARMKGGKEHRVALSRRAIELVKAQPAGEYVFAGRRPSEPMSTGSMHMVVKRMKLDATVHGFRSTFRDWAAETTSYPNHVVEMALAHEIGSDVEAAYRRGDLFDKRRRLMAEWARYCDTPQSARGAVVAFGKKKA